MPRRMGRPGLLGTMARTAVVAGTANAVVGGMDRKRATQAAGQQQQMAAQQAAFDAQQQLADMQAQMNAMQTQAQPQTPPPAPEAGGDLLGELQKLADMHGAGVLNDAEFAAAKARLLG
jgi:hypothetical protein